MSESITEILQSLSEQAETSGQTADELMQDDAYVEQSSKIVNEALKGGFDVLQLENGDIVTTGTKVVVYQYSWDEESGKMKKRNVTDRKRKSEKS